MFLAARAYAFNCPDGECSDAFTIGVGDPNTTQMGFTVALEGARLDIASAVGGTGALRPGRCLYQMGEHDMIPERNAFLDAYCNALEGNPGDFTDCNVDVTATSKDTDGRNDSWDIVASGDTGLICGFEGRQFVVYGVVTDVSFEIQVDVK